MGDRLDELYESYNRLDAATKNQTNGESGASGVQALEACYLSILSAVKGTKAEKQLCSPFISKFFAHFPQHYDAAIDALLDLCEDDDTQVRRHAIRELPNICRQNKEYVPKMADVLAQLLQTEDNSELLIVNQSLTTLAKCHPIGFFGGLFSQIIAGEDVVRERSIKFLKDRLKQIPADMLTKEVEECFLEETRKVMVDVNKEEFITFMALLNGLKISKSLSGQQTLLEIVREQAELGQPLDTSDLDSVDKLLMCVRHAIPLFSPFSPSTEFVKYLCIQVLPQLSEIEAKQSGLGLDFLQALAEMTPFVSPNIDSIEAQKCLSRVFAKLLEYMPTPETTGDSEVTEKAADNSSSDGPSLQFSHIECLLYAFQQLCRFDQQFVADAQSERVKDLRLRLQYVARGGT